MTGSRPTVGVPPEGPIEPPEPESPTAVGAPASDDHPAPVSVDEYAERARELLPRVAFDYFAGGAGEEWTLRENRAAFHRWVLRPRVLVDVSERDTSTTVLSTPVRFPVLVAPTAMLADVTAMEGLAKSAEDGWYSDSPTLSVYDYYNFWTFASHFLYWNRMIGKRTR